ncbi:MULTISPECIES: DUF3093 domain-containing protein [unclassified Microbacterium]|uniref:DUF3093 domain-containing protein n=1 Tax=unclassified Microbacterium TaxID=2609290 RepID=UPI001E2C6E80|nr:DUF3093 domain-containing protein [Microbacterium sp. Au-Mic1]MCE4025172.1 DUF3093 domain-containing protein [Microbacterium sp. Au-Mic1]
MQNAARDAGPSSRAIRYRERLAPSLWLFLAAALGGPMLALVFVPAGSGIALVIGAIATLAIIALMIAGSPSVAVERNVLRAGRAWIDASWLGEPEVRTGEDARQARGPGLPARGWHLIRGGIDGVVIVPNTDPADPAPSWTISSRTPDRLAAAIDAARASANPQA